MGRLPRQYLEHLRARRPPAGRGCISRAAQVVEQRFVISRVISNPIEPRGCIGEFDRRAARYILYGCIASTHSVRKILAEDVFRIAETNIRVVGADIGGTFGSKGNTSPENLVTLWASKHVGRPIKWIANRSEGFLSDEHGRDSIAEAQLALDTKGIFWRCGSRRFAIWAPICAPILTFSRPS